MIGKTCAQTKESKFQYSGRKVIVDIRHAENDIKIDVKHVKRPIELPFSQSWISKINNSPTNWRAEWTKKKKLKLWKVFPSLIFLFPFIFVLKWFVIVNCKLWCSTSRKSFSEKERNKLKTSKWFRIKPLQWTMLAINAKHRPVAVIWEWVWAWMSVDQHSLIRGWCRRKIYAPSHTNKCRINIRILLCIRSSHSNLGTCFILFISIFSAFFDTFQNNEDGIVVTATIEHFNDTESNHLLSSIIGNSTEQWNVWSDHFI